MIQSALVQVGDWYLHQSRIYFDGFCQQSGSFSPLNTFNLIEKESTLDQKSVYIFSKVSVIWSVTNLPDVVVQFCLQVSSPRVTIFYSRTKPVNFSRAEESLSTSFPYCIILKYPKAHLLLASCWLLCVLLAQFAISVSASLRIRSDLVRDEWALRKENWWRKEGFVPFSQMGRNQVISWLPHSLYDQRTIRDILPLYVLCKGKLFRIWWRWPCLLFWV